MQGRPWLFDSSLLSLKQFDGSIQPTKMDFSNEIFWIQMHNLPLACINEFMGNLIGNNIGSIKECDVDADGTRWGKTL